MPTVEFVQVQHCAGCGRDHRHVETHQVRTEAEAAREARAFEARCDHWLRLHLERLESRRTAAPQRRACAPLRIE